MKIWLLHTLRIGLPFAQLLVKEIKVEGIISLKSGIINENEYYEYSEFCNAHDISYVSLNSYSIKSEEDKNTLLNLQIDLLIVSSWQRLVPGWLIEHCSIGVIGGHGSPAGITGGRGRSPQNWAILSGHREFLISIFWIDTGIDDGRIIDTMSFSYEQTDDIVISYEKTYLCMIHMIVNNINGKIIRHEGLKQPKKGEYLPKRVKEDGMIDWNRSCFDVYNFVRALTIPYPCAFSRINGSVVYIIECKPITNIPEIFLTAKNGEVLIINPDNRFIWVKVNDGIVEIRKYMFEEGENVIIKEGDIFESADFKKQIESIISRHDTEIGLPVASMIKELLN